MTSMRDFLYLWPQLVTPRPMTLRIAKSKDYMIFASKTSTQRSSDTKTGLQPLESSKRFTPTYAGYMTFICYKEKLTLVYSSTSLQKNHRSSS